MSASRRHRLTSEPKRRPTGACGVDKALREFLLRQGQDILRKKNGTRRIEKEGVPLGKAQFGIHGAFLEDPEPVSAAGEPGCKESDTAEKTHICELSTINAKFFGNKKEDSPSKEMGRGHPT